MWNRWSNSTSNNFLDHFTWLCKIIACLCKISLQILLSLRQKSLFWSISDNHAKNLHDHAKLHHMVFKLLFGTSFFFFFFYSTLTTSNWLQILIQLHCFFLKRLFVLFNFISFFCLSMHQYRLEIVSKPHKNPMFSKLDQSFNRKNHMFKVH